YWILLVVGVALLLLAAGVGGGDDDLDIDADIDLDADIGADGLDADAEASGGFSSLAVLSWLGVGKTPLLLLLAIDLCAWGLLGWSFNTVLSAIWGTMPRFPFDWMVLGLSFAIAISLGSTISRPIGKLFGTFGEDTSSDRLVGRSGTVVSNTIPVADSGRIGQVDVLDAANNLVTVSAVLPGWANDTPKRGDRAILIDRHERGYFVVSETGGDRDRWLSSNASR
ncbi:MAG: DUF1449 domain-containing protein, partial [Cyanobacteria bacterium J06639_1]